MGISSGSKGGGKGYGGKGKDRSRALVTPPAQRTRHRPIENPYPEKEAFRLGTFRVIEEKDDYLICRGYDPNAKHPFSEVTPSASVTIEVAKPPLLQRTPWDGVTVEIAGITYTYEYSNDEKGVRTKRWTDENDEEQEEEERIDIPYFVDDLLVAVETSISRVVDGMDVYGTKAQNENGALLTWMDQNVSGRHWHTPNPFDCSLPNMDRFEYSEGEGEGVDIEDHTMDRGCGWEYRARGSGFSLVGGTAYHGSPGETSMVVTEPDEENLHLGLHLQMNFNIGVSVGEDSLVAVYLLFNVEDNNNLYFLNLFAWRNRRAALALYRVVGGVTNLIQIKQTNWHHIQGSNASMFLCLAASGQAGGVLSHYGVVFGEGGRLEDNPYTGEEECEDALAWEQQEENWAQQSISDVTVVRASRETQTKFGFGARNEFGTYSSGTQFLAFSAGFSF
jgi:hypothetical protein